MSIKILSKNVINQISAGEVVEKPASIVKELVENSIDAGATEIVIEIKNGGIDYISVQDNGTGINSNEIKLAFTPHATSKLEKIDDLNSIATMGFRGEALATISAVSKVTLITKTENEDIGTMVYLEGGEEIYQKEVATVKGTKIQVENIFYNTPARLKFLRKPKTEENEITNYVEKLILGNRNVAFKYIVDNKLIYNTISSNTHDKIYTIYGREVADNMLQVDYNSGEYFVTGFISKPEFAKANRTYQNLFVNNRFCNNALVSTAVSNAYENFTMKGKFPVYVLYLNLPQNEVDVNVHPNKLEVKFENTQKIYRVFFDAVFKALSDFNHIRTINSDQESTQNLNDSVLNNPLTDVKKEGVSFSDAEKREEFDRLINEYSNSIVDSKNSTGSYDFRTDNRIIPSIEIEAENKPIIENNVYVINDDNDKSATQINEDNIEVHKVLQEDFKSVLALDYKMIGVAFNTYLIIEFEDKLFLIDQHACHERQRYDEIMNQINSNSLKVQDLLIPFIIKVNQNESNFLMNNLSVLNSFGIDISEFGYNTFKVSSVPLLILDMDLNMFFDEMFDNLNSFAKTPQDTIKSRFMQMACKSAVKGGDHLSDLEIKSLLDTVKTKTEILLCPHGRPIVVEITKNQIEKWFKRIV